MFKCELCGKEFELERSFSGHKGICGKTKECPVCKKQISVPSFSRHVKAHEHDKSCLVCSTLITEKRKKFCSQSCAKKILYFFLEIIK